MMATANATCYFPDGTSNALGQSCNPSAAVSHCCESTHVCLSNGLCLDTTYNHVIRVSCTDASWLDPSCPQYCKDDTTTIYGDLRQCDDSDTDWVCGVDPSDCTNSFQVAVGYIDDNRDQTLSAIVALPSVYTTSAAVATGGSATVTTTVTATITAGSSAESSPTSKSNSATTVGLGAGLGVGIPLLAALCVSLLLLWRAHKKIKALEGRHPVARSELPNQAYPDPIKWQPKHEVDNQYIHEVPGSRP